MKISSFIRLTDAGTFEKITWNKAKDGTKTVSKKPVKVSPDQALRIAESKYQEIFI